MSADAESAASLFAVDPHGSGGVCLRSHAGPLRDRWLAILRQLLPDGTPWRRVPFNIADGRLLGGLDLVATLKANRPVAERGVLAESSGGVLLLAMAERLGPGTAARIGAALDHGEVLLSREGVSLLNAARVGIVALDEGIADEERVPAALLDRFAFLLDLNVLSPKLRLEPAHSAAQIAAARQLLPRVHTSEEILKALCATAIALGAGSPRVGLLALRAARAAAALAGRAELIEADATLAARLVLAPRATIAPAEEAAEPADPPPPETEPSEAPSPDPGEGARQEPREPEKLEDVVLAAAQAAIPAGLLALLRADAQQRARAQGSGGRSGALQRGGARGRPAGVFSGAPRGTARLNLIETLRAAAPWQPLRAARGDRSGRIRVSTDDFRVTRYRQRAQTLTIFVIDASGSAALHRLAEAKGAVELLLADCYIRRDQVAVIAFRGRKAQLLLPPTRSLVRAKRSLAGLPGGGGTPLAGAIDAAHDLAMRAVRRGETPTIVLLTDGRANIARDGAPGRELAQSQALLAARSIRAARLAVLLVDTSPRAGPLGAELAASLGARHLPLPIVNAKSLSLAVRAATSR